MQVLRIRLQGPQLELFLNQSEVIDWHILSHQTQQEVIRLLAKLLREDSGTQLPRSMVAERSHEGQNQVTPSRLQGTGKLVAGSYLLHSGKDAGYVYPYLVWGKTS